MRNDVTESLSLRKHASSFPRVYMLAESAIEKEREREKEKNSGTEFVIPFDTFCDIKRVISLLLYAQVGYFRRLRDHSCGNTIRVTRRATRNRKIAVVIYGIALLLGFLLYVYMYIFTLPGIGRALVTPAHFF